MPPFKNNLLLVFTALRDSLLWALFCFVITPGFSQTGPPTNNYPTPNITYHTPHLLTVNTPIVPIVPNNLGAPIAANGFTGRTLVGTGTNHVKSLTTSPSGFLYTADYDAKTVSRLDYVVNGGSGPPGTGRLSWPTPTGATSIALSSSGDVFIADNLGHTISRIEGDGTISVFAGSGVAGFANGQGTTASFNQPYGIAFGVDGSLYVADMQNNAIRKITPDGLVTTVAGNGTTGHVNGSVANATFNAPGWLATDGDGNIYVSENGAIRKITPDGQVTTVAGIGGPAQLSNINFDGGGIKVDDYGNIYAAHRQWNQIIMITPANNYTVFDGLSSSGNALNGPQDIAFDNAGNLYVAQQNSNFVKFLACGYTINHPLPPGLTFDKNTGIISGTPTAPFPRTDYIITAFINYTGIPGELNGSKTSSAPISIEVNSTTPLSPSIITFPPQSAMTMDADGFLDPKATSTNNETPIVYKSSSNTSVAIIQNGRVKIVGPGVTVISATQAGNANFWPANLAVVEIAIKAEQRLTFPAIAAKLVCAADFVPGATSDANGLTITYTSSDLSVATVNSAGIVHIVGVGTTTITASQPGNNSYMAAAPVTQQLTVTAPPGPAPSLSLTADVDNVYPGIPITFTATAINTGTSTDYQWKVNGQNVGANNPVYSSNTLKNGDVITCTVITNVTCAVPLTATLSVTIKSPLTIRVVNSFSPNGDGINDIWDIPDLAYYPNCLMNVYSRSGQLVFQSRGYAKPWDGSSNGKALPVAAYYYVLLLDAGKQSNKLSGHVTVVR